MSNDRGSTEEAHGSGRERLLRPIPGVPAKPSDFVGVEPVGASPSTPTGRDCSQCP